MLDLHTHVLPQLDDGVRSLQESVQVLAAAAREGVTHLAATPHVRDDYPTGAAEMERLVEEVRTAAREAHLRIEVLRGGEVALERLATTPVEELRRFGLGGNPQFLLVEFPYFGFPPALAEQLTRLIDLGMTPVLAHPERNAEVQAAPQRLEPLVREGMLVQLTASSVSGAFGNAARTTAHRLLEFGLAHLLASDVHQPARRTSLAAAAATIGSPALAHWLTVDVPASIVADEPLPARPETRPIRDRFRR